MDQKRVCLTVPAEQAGERRQEDEHQHRCQILDHQPADSDLAIVRFQQAARFQRLEQNHGTGAGE